MSISTDFETQLTKINTKFEEIRKEACGDCKIDRTAPFEQFNTMLIEKWIRKRVEWNKLCRTYDEKRKEKFRSLYEYYKTDFDIKLSTKDEYFLFIESDSNYTAINSLFLNTKEVVSYIDSTLENLKSRAWEIKSFIEWSKFVNGV